LSLRVYPQAVWTIQLFSDTKNGINLKKIAFDPNKIAFDSNIIASDRKK
jgi:hypothetical protein